MVWRPGLFFPMVVITGISCLVGWAALHPFRSSGTRESAQKQFRAQLGDDWQTPIAAVDQQFRDHWREVGITPAAAADERLVLRRLSLALVGTIPPLAEIREFEADQRVDRLRWWTLRYLADRRFAEYFAERLAVTMVGLYEQKIPLFSHARFEAWLADQLAAGRPYDQWVREMLSATGPPTSQRAANFVTAEIVQGEQYANRLTARAARVFLGQRIDCAECHDHPFDDWKQANFQGLAAFFAQVRVRSLVLEDDRRRVHEVEDRKTLEKQVVEPDVPFHVEWLGDSGSRRERFADWVTHRENDRFWRAIANRLWGLVYGRPLVSPVDSIPDPATPENADEPEPPLASRLLDLLADDLREHGGDLRRTILVIASTQPFRLASTHPLLETGGAADLDRLDEAWGAFPLVQLRPEQLARSLEQLAAIQALPADPQVYTMVQRELWFRKFLDQYGSLDENELDERSDSIPQTIHRMYSRFTRDQSRTRWFNAAGRISMIATDDLACLNACYLVCLSREPETAEQQLFLPQLQEVSRNSRPRVVEDIFWTLVNSPEFSWNH